MTKIYLTRHGQTEWNVQKRMQGHKDSPLTELGNQQAHWLREALVDVDFDAVYSSTATRAFDTTKIICQDRDLVIEKKDQLREMGFGVWEGQSVEKIREEFYQPFITFWHKPHLYKPTDNGGESFKSLEKRVLTFLNKLLDEHQNETILLVAHTLVVKTIMAFFEGRPLEKLWDEPFIHPTCLNIIDVEDGESNIILHGDTSHYQVEV